VIEDVAGRAVLDARFVKGERERLLTRAFMIRAIVVMTLMPDAGPRDAILALAGDLAGVPWARPWQAASELALSDWRSALGPGPLLPGPDQGNRETPRGRRPEPPPRPQVQVPQQLQPRHREGHPDPHRPAIITMANNPA
jgi:hypothetical protein